MRIAKNPFANPAELQAMPEVAKSLLDVLKQTPKGVCGVPYRDYTIEDES